MSDFWRSLEVDPFADEEDQRDPFARTSQRASGSDDRVNPLLAGVSEPVYQRNFMERVFAPFEAPQQTTFKLTTEIANDGFQMGDVWKALQHGGNYFNPLGNTEPILADEIRQIFMGPDAADAIRTWQTTATNLGISLLYDPLWFAPLGKAAGLSGRSLRALERAADPAMLGIDAVRIGVQRGVRPAARAVGTALTGSASAWDKVATEWSQRLLSQWSGVPEQARLIMERRDARINIKRQEAGSIIREMNKLNNEGHRLLAEAMESNAIASLKGYRGEGLDRTARTYLDGFQKRLRAAGVDEDLFWQSYERMQGIETAMIEEMYRQAVVTGDEFRDMYGVHLRRMYDYYENPQAVVERIDRLLEAGGDANKYANDYNTWTASTLDRRLQRVEVKGDNIMMGGLTRRDRKAVRAGERQFRDVTAAREAFGPRDVPTTDDLLQKYYATPTDTQITSNARRGNVAAFTENRPRLTQEALERAETTNDPAAWWAAARLEKDGEQALVYAREGLAAAKEAGQTSYVRGFQRYIADLDKKNVLDATEQRYFRRENGEIGFNRKNFIEDFLEFTNTNPDAPIDDVLKHVRDVMFAGRTVSPEFYKGLADTITYAATPQAGLRTIKDKLVGINTTPSAGWVLYRERMQDIATREDIPSFIREEILGEIESPARRFVEGTIRGSEVLETSKMFDEMSGAVRVNESLADINRRFKAGEIDVAEARRLVADTSGLNDVDAINRVLSVDETEVAFTRGTDLASPNANPAKGHTVRLPKSDELGSMSEQYVSPGLAAQLTRLIRPRQAGTSSQNIWNQMGEALKKGTSIFKMFKIILDPAAHWRDTVGTMMQMDIMTNGKMPFRMDRMWRTWKNYEDFIRTGRSEYADIAAEVGLDLFGSTYTAGELRRGAEFLEGMDFRWTKEHWRDSATNLFRALKQMGDKYGNWMSTQYQTRENMFRLYVFSEVYDDIISKAVREGTERTKDLELAAARQAATKVNQTLFNYADLPVVAQFARDYGIMPFITFPFKAIPQAASILYERPMNILKYERGLEEWNHHFAGGPDEYAREIAALPEHKRESLVVRLPFTDVDDRAQYLDLSYFMPWYVIKDLQADTFSPFVRTFGEPANAEGLTETALGDIGLRSNVLTPPLMALFNGISNNQDGLGRPIIKPSMTQGERYSAIGRFLMNFIAPATAPFVGTTSNSIGRALQAVTFTEGTGNDWTQWMINTTRGVNPPADAVNRYGERPVTRSNVGGSQLAALLGVDQASPAGVTMGAIEGLFWNVTAVDPQQQARNTRVRMNLSNTELAREIAQIRQNPDMSIPEKNEAIRRLQLMQRQIREETNERISAMF